MYFNYHLKSCLCLWIVWPLTFKPGLDCFDRAAKMLARSFCFCFSQLTFLWHLKVGFVTHIVTVFLFCLLVAGKYHWPCLEFNTMGYKVLYHSVALFLCVLRSVRVQGECLCVLYLIHLLWHFRTLCLHYIKKHYVIRLRHMILISFTVGHKHMTSSQAL